MARTASRGRTIAIGIAVAVVVVGALGAAAYVMTRDYGSSTAAYSPSSSAPTATATAAAPAYTGSRFLVAVDDQHAWRSASGKCSTDSAFVEVTADGGATWTPAPVARDEKPTAVLALSATSPTAGDVISQTAAKCEPSQFGTTDAGASWTDAQPTGAWWIRPSDFRVVNAAGTAVDAPCQGRRVYGYDPNDAMLVCNDGVVFRTSDGGTAWDAGGNIPGVLSVSPVSGGYLVALRGDASCPGIQFRKAGLTASAADGAVIGCYPVTLGEGSTAIAAAPSGIWVWTQNRVEHVTDPWAVGLRG
ncbi:hypothetical protein WDJ51_04040 [Rathayibacter sp. YIM 133350]|uniref:hypothetical protein n=1 Tax=Rathayibacter sp. YIM 133350 TaxID=3131992 RepID=UPI00307CC9CC